MNAENGGGSRGNGRASSTGRKPWKPKTAEQAARLAQTRSMYDRHQRISVDLKHWPQDDLSWVLAWFNTGRSSHVKVDAHGRAGALNDTTIQNLTTLLKGVTHVFQAQRDQAAMQLNMAVNGGSNMQLDIDGLLLFLVAKGSLATGHIPEMKQHIMEWLASRPTSQHPEQQAMYDGAEGRPCLW